MLIKSMELGPLGTNCYIVIDEKTLECAVVDPAGDASTLLDYLEDNHLSCRYLLLTHGHFDHVGAVEDVMAETGATLCMHKADDGLFLHGDYDRFDAPEGTTFYKEGDVVSLSNVSFTVMETPGHTRGCVTLLARDAGDGDAVLFTGDTLFRDSCGRTDFPHSNPDDMMASLKRLAQLPGDYEVYPGHGLFTTLDRERKMNFFMAQAMRG